MECNMTKTIDYINEFNYAVFAYGQGKNFLALERLNEPFKRLDGEYAHYQLEYRWLSQSCESETDQAWACVLGSDFTYWKEDELEKLFQAQQHDPQFNPFEHFDLL